MTCRSCKRLRECDNPRKSSKYDPNGDNYANWCEDFYPIRETISVELDGYEAIQTWRSNHVTIRDMNIDRLVAHFSCRKRKNEKQLRDMIINYEAWLKAHRKERVVVLDETEIMREWYADGRQGKF